MSALGHVGRSPSAAAHPRAARRHRQSVSDRIGFWLWRWHRLGSAIAVEQRGWLSDAEFLEIVSLCQFLPGPNIIGIAVCTGTKLRGALGALAAIAGFLMLPWSVGLALGVLCLRYAQAPLLRHILGGISAAAAGLLIATGLRLLLPYRRRLFVLGLVGLTMVLMVFSRLSLPVVLFALLPLGIAMAAARRS